MSSEVNRQGAMYAWDAVLVIRMDDINLAPVVQPGARVGDVSIPALLRMAVQSPSPSAPHIPFAPLEEIVYGDTDFI